MVEPVYHDTQGQHLHPVDGFPATLATSQHARQSRNFRQPPAIIFLLDFNC